MFYRRILTKISAIWTILIKQSPDYFVQSVKNRLKNEATLFQSPSKSFAHWHYLVWTMYIIFLSLHIIFSKYTTLKQLLNNINIYELWRLISWLISNISWKTSDFLCPNMQYRQMWHDEIEFLLPHKNAE